MVMVRLGAHAGHSLRTCGTLGGAVQDKDKRQGCFGVGAGRDVKQIGTSASAEVQRSGLRAWLARRGKRQNCTGRGAAPNYAEYQRADRDEYENSAVAK